MPIALPSAFDSGAYIVAIVLGSIAAWYFGGVLVKWVQAYRNRVETAELEAARKQAQEDNRKANSESDQLKKIDGR